MLGQAGVFSLQAEMKARDCRVESRQNQEPNSRNKPGNIFERQLPIMCLELIQMIQPSSIDQTNDADFQTKSVNPESLTIDDAEEKKRK